MHPCGSRRFESFSASASHSDSFALLLLHHVPRYHTLRRRRAVLSVDFPMFATRSVSTWTRMHAVPQRSHGPSQTLLASNESVKGTCDFLSVRCASVPWAAAQESSRLSPGAAVVLAQRARESVLRQERCAADLHYFMSAERRARQRFFPAIGASPPALRSQSPEGNCAPRGVPAAMDPLVLVDNYLDAHVFSSSTSWEDLDLRLATPFPSELLRESPTVSREVDTASGWRAPTDEHIGCGGCSYSRSASPLFRQQQTLFDLRRRLAYLLASDCTGAEDSDKKALPLRGTFRRAALALSLTQSILEVSFLNAGVSEASRNTEGISTGAPHCNVQHPRMQSGGLDESTTSLVRPLQPDRRGLYPYVYRSVAQPIELTPAEAYALLRWCADQVCTCAHAVAAAAHQSDSPEHHSLIFHSDAATSLAADCGGPEDGGGSASSACSATEFCSGHKPDGCGGAEKRGGCKGRASRKASDSTLPRLSTSAIRSPSTLWMAKRLPGDRTSKYIDGNNTWPSTFGGLERERTEEVVFSATALMELVAAFARTAAELALPMADGFSGHSHEETVPQMQPPAHARLRGSEDSCYGGDAVSGSEEFLGGFVENVVSGACTALDAVRCTGHLCAYAKTRVGSRNRDASSCGSGGHSAPAMVFTATHDEGQGQLRSLYNRLSFSQTAFQSVLCCERESWSKALQLTERMSEWNASLDGLLGVSSLATSTSATSSQLDALSPPRLPAIDGRDATIPLGATCPKRAAHLRGLSRSTAYMLLYVLAQHGRLAEVLRLCETIFSTNALDLLRGWSTFDKHGADADAGLALILHLAVANTDPAAAGASALSAASVDLDLEARVYTALLDRMRCIECVVCAGVMPQRMLSVTEYATLVRRLLGDQVRSDAACHEFAATTMRRASPSSSLGWWLSPSQVWRLSAGLEHHVRATLCLMGFQVNVRHGQTDMLNLEDLYVVLTITRQLVRRHDIDLRQLRDRQAKSLGGSGGDDGGDADGELSKPQSRRWVDWGVVTGNTKWTPLNSSSPPSELLSHPPPPTVTGTCAEVGAVSGCWTDLKARAPAKVALHAREEFLLHLLPARRLAGSPTGADYVYQLCTTSHAVCHRALLSFPPAYVEKSGFTAQHITPMPRQIPGVGAVNRGAASSTVAGSAVLLSLVSQETLSLLRAVCYTRNITLFWSSALGALAAQQLSVQASAAGAAGTLPGDGGFSERTAFASSATRVRGNWLQPEEGSESLREEVAYALAHQAEVAVGVSLVATRRLVDPLIVLAPYLSAYTVSALVQRPFRRAFTWQQCLALLPYTPLGSRSQLWLVRRIAQDNKGRRGAFPDVAAAPVSGASPAPGPRTLLTRSALSITTLETAEKMVAVQAAHQRHQRHQRHQCSSERAVPNATLDAAQAAQRSRLVASPSSAESSASVSADAMAHADGALLALLLEGNWKRALQAFEEAPSRVQVGGAPHVVRLLVAADVWRHLSDAQRRPLVRLAVQGSAHSLGGVSGLLEEVLQTTLEHGLWHTGLYFHRSVAVEQPELVRQCRRAQCYAAQLCQGLLRRTSMTKTVAQMTKAVRRSQWAEAAACFLRYATQQRDGTPVVNTSLPPVHPLSDTPTGAPLEDAAALHTAPVCAASEKAAPPHAARTTAVPPTTSEELHLLAALIDADESVVLQPHTRARASSSLPAFNLLCNSGDALIPLELAHVAQTARYAMLHTPLLWVRALQWLPKTALPLPFSHEQAWRVLCADNTEKLRAVLPPAVQLEASLDERGGASAEVAAAAAAVAAATVEDTVAMVTSTTEAALSLVEAARRAHRPQHANEVGKEQRAAVANALRVLHRAGAWEQAALLYDKAVESHCMPYASSSKVLEAAQQGGAPWQVTLTYFFRMSQRQRPDVNATAVALQACVEGGQWETAFRVLRQSVLTQAAPVPRLVMLAVNTALQCGVWSRALAAAHQYRRTRNPQLAHTVLLAYVRTQHWDDATEYFYDCTRRGLRPLDASLELAIIASEAASAEYRKTALMVGAIASALEDLYRMSGAVLEHIIFVHRQAQRGALHWQTVSSSPCCMPKRALHGAADIDHDGDFVLAHPAAASSRDEAHHADADYNRDTV